MNVKEMWEILVTAARMPKMYIKGTVRPLKRTSSSSPNIINELLQLFLSLFFSKLMYVQKWNKSLSEWALTDFRLTGQT